MEVGVRGIRGLTNSELDQKTLPDILSIKLVVDSVLAEYKPTLYISYFVLFKTKHFYVL